MKKVTIIAAILIILGVGAYIIGSYVVSDNLSNNASIINKPGAIETNQDIINASTSLDAKVALNTTPTTSIAAPIVDNKKNIVSNNTSIVNPKGEELSTILSTQSPVGYNINSIQVVGNLNVEPYQLKVYSKPDINSKYGYLHSNSRYVTITGEYKNWYRISIGNYVGFIAKDKVEISAVVNAGNSFIKCNLIGCVNGINSNNILLNVRKSPNPNSEIIYRLSNVGNFNIIGAIGNWYEVDVQGTLGYVDSKYVGTILPSILENNFRIMDNITPVTGDLKSTASYIIKSQPVSAYLQCNSNVPVYSKPSSNSSLEYYLSNNYAFECIELGPNWIKIIYNGKIGYILEQSINNL